MSCLTDNAVMTIPLTIGGTPSGSQRHVSPKRRQNSIARVCLFFFFLGGGLSFRRKLIGVLVFEITKTKTPKFTVRFDLKLGGKDRTKDNLTLYFDGFDFRGSYSFRNLEN